MKIKCNFLPSASSDVIDKIGVPLDIDETLLMVLKTLSFKEYVFDPLNDLFGSGNTTYSEDIITKSTVNEVLFKVSNLFTTFYLRNVRAADFLTNFLFVLGLFIKTFTCLSQHC